jgi:hypothetical protein
MSGSIGGLEGVPSQLRGRIPISLDGVVAEGPVSVNHGSDYDRWRLVRADGTLLGQVRVSRGIGERGKEAVYIPPRRNVEDVQFSLPYADDFSQYMRTHLEAYLQEQENTTPIDRTLRRGPTIIGVVGTTYFLRWNVYLNDEKIGKYTVHDMDNEKAEGVQTHNGERTYRGRIPGYINHYVVAWNDIQSSSEYPHLLEQDSVSLHWARLPGEPTLDNKYPVVWKRGDFLRDIPFP